MQHGSETRPARFHGRLQAHRLDKVSTLNTFMSTPRRLFSEKASMKHALLLPLLVPVLVSGSPARAQITRPAPEQALARAIYKEFIEIPSGFTTGATTPVARAAAARLKAAGFPDVDIHVDGPNPRKANLVVRYHGTGARKPLLLLAHTDVVEAKREDWSMDPFKLIEKDGYFYGRGTGYDKPQAAVWIANLIQYRKEGFKPDRDVTFPLPPNYQARGPVNASAERL